MNGMRPDAGRAALLSIVSLLFFDLALFFEFALSLLSEFAPLTLQLRVLHALRDTLFSAPLDDLHLGLDAALDLVNGREFTEFLLGHNLVDVDLH